MHASQPDAIMAGRFGLTRKLTQAGSAEVFAALDQSTGQGVALERLLDQGGKLAKQAAVARSMRGYHALSELRHPRIIEVYDYGVEHGRPYYTMELLDGHNLNELSPLPYPEAAVTSPAASRCCAHTTPRPPSCPKRCSWTSAGACAMPARRRRT